MSLKDKLCDANRIVIGGRLLEVVSHDPQQMKTEAVDFCLFCFDPYEEEQYNYCFTELEQAENDDELLVYTFQLWDNIPPGRKQLELACEENFPGSEIITFMEALERWTVLSKYEQQSIEDCLKLRTLGQSKDAVDIINRATKAEYFSNKKANVATQLMHAMQCGRDVVFYEWTDSTGSICKGGRYGTEGYEYASFHL